PPAFADLEVYRLRSKPSTYVPALGYNIFLKRRLHHATRSAARLVALGRSDRARPGIAGRAGSLAPVFRTDRKASNAGRSKRSPAKVAISSVAIRSPNRTVGAKLLRVSASIPMLETTIDSKIGPPVVNKATRTA